MPKPILFYSKKNTASKNLWRKLLEKNKLEQFVKICVDNNNKIPSSIRSTPALLIKGRPLVYGSAIEMFLNTNTINLSKPIIDTKRVNFQKPTNIKKKLDKKPEIKTSTNGFENILDFNPIEMSANLSDSYSFIQNNPEPLDFCYQFIEPGENITDSTLSTTEKTTKGHDLETRLQELQNSRKHI
tara:strand:+ start:2458 stop:3012 length:555 start_codon:yes stop_codon:yes gene_type:complete